MEFMSGYYRQKEDSTALLLQQYVCHGVPVCLGCVCGGKDSAAGMAGGLFTGLLLRAFRGADLSQAVEKPSRFLKKMEKRIYRCRADCDVPTAFWMAGILCAGESFLLFAEGKVKISLCNIGFGRPSLHEIRAGDGERRMRMLRGSMEPGIGILLASENFYDHIPRSDMQDCLSVKDINDSGQTRKRIRELGEMAEQRGGRGMGALLLEVR
ncbi:MAG: hypothetical protein NC305_09090 [Lachnospiraceae bacterium]|nr:hypothetical protein [Butyrivibrio sp.]MCM1410688.1 hypothetical protein [Lachnospiraceae bacterium]